MLNFSKCFTLVHSVDCAELKQEVHIPTKYTYNLFCLFILISMGIYSSHIHIFWCKYNKFGHNYNTRSKTIMCPKQISPKNRNIFMLPYLMYIILRYRMYKTQTLIVLFLNGLFLSSIKALNIITLITTTYNIIYNVYHLSLQQTTWSLNLAAFLLARYSFIVAL